MTYLNSPRLHFAGNFRADVSTVNNYVTHFRDPNDPQDPGWNATGSARWTLDGCTVTRAVRQDGTIAQTAADDPVIGLALTQVGRAVMVDLDPEQQLVSQIWGLQMQLGRPGTPAFGGAFKTAAFSDLWFIRAPSGPGGDANMTAFYQSVLAGVSWGDLGDSPLLSELQQSSDADLLSIKFNVDGFNQGIHVGRIVGTIGPAHADEPVHFVRGRHCMPLTDGPVGFFPALVDAHRGKLVADFGNALQTTSSGGPFDSSVDIEIGVGAGNDFHSLGKVPIGDGDWYERTAGVCEFPPDRVLTAKELTKLETTPLAVRQRVGGNTVASEGVDGVHVRAEDFVYRMSANDDEIVTLHATSFGQPLPNATIDVRPDFTWIGSGDPQHHNVGEPANGLTYPASVKTDASGVAQLPLGAGSIARPREYIDGQLYGIGYAVSGSDPEQGAYANHWNFISALVWTDYRAPDEPAWNQDVEPILSEYAELYEVMKDIVDLADYDSVVDSKDDMEKVFNLPQDSPHYMPVTRDLSPAKRQMILDWLQTTGNAGRPNLDRSPGAGPAGAPAPGRKPVRRAAAPKQPGPVATLGGKTAALERLGEYQE
jgi:hypothetical protein